MSRKRKETLDGDTASPAKPMKLSRQPRGRDIPAGTLGQEIAGLRIFQSFLDQVGVDGDTLIAMNKASHLGAASDAKNFYSLLTAFSVHLQNSSSSKARSDNKLLAKPTVLGYFSQTVNFLRERYPQSLPDSKRVTSIRDKMGSAIDERNLRANVTTNDAPGCTVEDLRTLIDHQVGQCTDGYKSVHDAAVLVMMWHTFGRAIDTCFARKQQLTIASTNNDRKQLVRDQTCPTAYANGNSKLAIQWISTRGAWLLDSLTKVFAYIGTTTREDQCVGKVLAGYEDPNAPVSTPRFSNLLERLPLHEQLQAQSLKRELFRNVQGFDDHRMNVSDAVLDTALAAILIHLEPVLQHLRAVANEPTLYKRRINECLHLATNNEGSPLTLRQVCMWGETLRNLWRERNYEQLGALASGAEPAIVKLLQQVLAKTEALERSVALLVAANTASAVSQVATSSDIFVPRHLACAQPETASLAGALFAWYTTRLWEQGSSRDDQAVRCDYKSAINIMLVLATKPVLIPQEPLRTCVVAHNAWKQQLWVLAQELDANVNSVLGKIDAKRTTKKPAALRKRWAQIRKNHPAQYDALVVTHLRRIDTGSFVDDCTPPSHIWNVNDFPPK